MNGKHTIVDALLVASADRLVDDDATYLEAIDTSNTTISRRTEKKILRRIHRSAQSETVHLTPLSVRKVAVAVLVMCTLSFGLCLSVEAIRTEIWRTIVEYYEKYVAVLFVADEAPLSEIADYRKPQEIFPGTEEQVAAQSPDMYIIHYLKDGNLFATYSQLLADDAPVHLDSEECTISQVMIGEFEGQLFTYHDGTVSVVWHDNAYAYLISTFTADVDYHTICKVATSIK